MCVRELAYILGESGTGRRGKGLGLGRHVQEGTGTAVSAGIAMAIAGYQDKQGCIIDGHS